MRVVAAGAVSVSTPGKSEKLSLGMKLMRMAPGEFMMGSPETEEGRSDDEPQHRVRIGEDPRIEREGVVAGVPPDAFSDIGQRWGNPLYRWDRMAAEDFAWWTARIRRAMDQADVFRIDHFRGFAAHWEIPASEPTAIHGRWMPGPGAALFDAIAQALVEGVPIVTADSMFERYDVQVIDA